MTKNTRSARATVTQASNKSIRAFRAPTHADISASASALWESSGYPEGQDLAIWLEAERRLLADGLRADAEITILSDTQALLGEPTGTIEDRLQAFGAPSDGRSTTSL
jgi:hypothetical protein